jgi:hypothetical protein
MDGRKVKTTYKWKGDVLVGLQKWESKETTLKWQATGDKLTCVSFKRLFNYGKNPNIWS